jgi:hypothetical protein
MKMLRGGGTEIFSGIKGGGGSESSRHTEGGGAIIFSKFWFSRGLACSLPR